MSYQTEIRLNVTDLFFPENQVMWDVGPPTVKEVKELLDKYAASMCGISGDEIGVVFLNNHLSVFMVLACSTTVEMYDLLKIAVSAAKERYPDLKYDFNKLALLDDDVNIIELSIKNNE